MYPIYFLRFLALGIGVFFLTPVQALLPPFYQTAKEIIAILNNEQVAEKISSGRPISSIQRTEAGYQIRARECTLDVEIKPLPRKDHLVGPAEFEIKTGALTCDPASLSN